jgi:hypothetical protein
MKPEIHRKKRRRHKGRPDSQQILVAPSVLFAVSHNVGTLAWVNSFQQQHELTER